VDLLFASKYPFSSEAKAVVAGKSLSFDEISSAKARAITALATGELPTNRFSDSRTLEREVLSYAGAKVIVACLKSKYLAGRYSVAESKRAWKYLRDEDDDNLLKVASEIEVNFSTSTSHDFDYEMNFQDYLRFCPKDVKYKLVNRPLSNGKVLLSKDSFLRVIQEAIRLRIESTIPPDVSTVPQEFKKAVDEVRAALPKEETFGATIFLKEEDYPPCIKELLVKLRNSENLPHTARWFLAAFLLKSGMKEEQVAAAFRTAPDYEEHTTKYQVSYIAKKGYSVPSCASVESYGFCVGTCRAGSPVNYGKRARIAAAKAQGESEKKQGENDAQGEGKKAESDKTNDAAGY